MASSAAPKMPQSEAPASPAKTQLSSTGATTSDSNTGQQLLGEKVRQTEIPPSKMTSSPAPGELPDKPATPAAAPRLLEAGAAISRPEAGQPEAGLGKSL
ncbi:hypothetical protein K402DRAFT_424233 [Aulographum hederae CBS 113979]|uniref:Uncharacterized protein n=1 Tax=Aulographum hederae CBS 113979 TaxID=1176131 RepID=A0A6G1GPV0_9PEZI|nr:hypothetical protein K402DRAFT_424233 [Aulographum hederae CBS 113979]